MLPEKVRVLLENVRKTINLSNTVFTFDYYELKNGQYVDLVIRQKSFASYSAPAETFLNLEADATDIVSISMGHVLVGSVTCQHMIETEFLDLYASDYDSGINILNKAVSYCTGKIIARHNGLVPAAVIVALNEAENTILSNLKSMIVTNEATSEHDTYWFKSLLPATQEAVKNPVDGRSAELWRVIVNLNDVHKWSRDKIADWLESLDLDLEFKNDLP